MYMSKYKFICVYTVHTISSSVRSAKTAFSRSVTSSSKYWYLSFLRARHSLALCRLRSVKHETATNLKLSLKKSEVTQSMPPCDSCLYSGLLFKEVFAYTKSRRKHQTLKC